MTEQPHARAFDLPGWPCPPRVRDIPSHENSWGYVLCQTLAQGVFQDERGYLWADGDMVPAPRVINSDSETGAILFWTKQGLGVYMPPKALRFLGSISKLDMEPDRWIPIAVAAAELPEFVTEASVMER